MIIIIIRELVKCRRRIIRRNWLPANISLPGQRATVLEVMINNRGKHLSAEEDLQQARKLRPNIGIATVYRTLEKLASLEILYKGMFDSGKYRYELADDRGTPSPSCSLRKLRQHN